VVTAVLSVVGMVAVLVALVQESARSITT